jgi:phospholipid transport system substrate-binding protein
MKCRKVVFETIFVGIFFLMFTSTLLWSGEPEELVKEIILKNSSLNGIENIQQHRQKLWKEISHSFDFEEMSKRAMGKYWRNRSPEEKREFVKLFTKAIEGVYTRKTGYRFEGKIISLRETQGNKYAKVQTELITKIGKEKSAVFRLLKTNGEWKIYDVVFEGVSVVKNYRSQIHYIMAKYSYKELVRRMKQNQSKKQV